MRKARAFVIWEGASLIDSKPVVLIATRGTKGKANKKTGSMIQTYILRADLDPVTASKTGEDLSICGECPHRKASAGSCYVRVDQGPLIVYKAYKRGVYPRLSLTEARENLSGELVRLGAYGDPAAIPQSVWEIVLSAAKGWTGYTHQWKTAEGLKVFCMASCDSVAEAVLAQSRGWRTFAVVSKLDYATRHGLPVVPNSFLCPASEEGGRKLTCAECLACGGTSSPNKASVYIPVHGAAFKQERFKLITIGRV